MLHLHVFSVLPYGWPDSSSDSLPPYFNFNLNFASRVWVSRRLHGCGLRGWEEETHRRGACIEEEHLSCIEEEQPWSP